MRESDPQTMTKEKAVTVYTMENKPRILRRGDVVEQPARRRTGAQSDKVVIYTPCCGVEYRIEAEDIERHYGEDAEHPLDFGQECGRVQNGRGNRRGADGCRWFYRISFARDAEGNYTARWKA